MRTHYYIASIWVPAGTFRVYANTKESALKSAKKLASGLRQITKAKVTVRRVKENPNDRT